MDGRAFLEVAKELVSGQTEAHWRTGAGRSYYGLFQECRAALERWGFAMPSRDKIHFFVRQRFLYAADPDMKEIGMALDRLSTLRNQADYQLLFLSPFASARKTQRAFDDAVVNLARLDQLEADSARRSAVIADVRAKFP